MKDNCACHTDRTGCNEVQEFMALMDKILHPPAPQRMSSFAANAVGCMPCRRQAG